jgi:uncharacterized protein (UPF0332 family)
LDANTHSGVKTLLGKHFVRDGPISRDMGALYTEIFQNRLQADYDEFFEPDPEQVHHWLPHVRSFLSTVTSLLEE